MKHPTNKQERRDIERRKLENLYSTGTRKTDTHIKFIVKPEDCNVEEKYQKDCYKYTIMESIMCNPPECGKCSAHCYWYQEDNRYKSYDRPVAATKYALKKEVTGNHTRKFCKQQTNTKIRGDKDQLYQNGQYRKLFDMWWTMW